MISDFHKVILTDCDGVLMNWEYAFHTWMKHKGYNMMPGGEDIYDIGARYDISKEQKKKLIVEFNNSSSIGYLPPLRDAMYYIDLLHRKCGYVFHMITSLSLETAAQQLRIENTKKLFGETAFEKFIFCDTGADKDEVLEPYRDSGYLWVEDKIENAELGNRLGLQSIIMEHGHNMRYEELPRVKNWAEVYDTLV